MGGVGGYHATGIGPQLFNGYSPTNYNKRLSYRAWETGECVARRKIGL